MTCNEAKNLPIVAICDLLGAQRAYVKSGKMYALYHAPYRTDVHPSLMLDLKTNRWSDLATGEYGDALDLISRTLNCDTASSLRFLDNGVSFSVKKVVCPVKKKKTPGGLAIKPLSHPALLKYVHSRGISESVAKRFLQEYHVISPKGKPCFSLAFPSLSGGYELRNAVFKGCVGSKDISVIGKGHIFLFFEGFFDFLSHVEACGYYDFATYIVLNSTAMVQRAVNYLAGIGAKPSLVELWLDADESGREAASSLQREYPGAHDMSYVYAECATDLNAYLPIYKCINKEECVSSWKSE